MINSLSKDSHITQSTCHPKSHPSERSAQPSLSSSVSLYSSSTSVNKKTAEPSFSGFFSSKDVAKPAGIFTEKWVKKFLVMAADKPTVFNAAFAIGLTCFLRPAAIMALPSGKKNADDNKYAAAHSVASGVIGYGIALAIFDPISKAFKLAISKDNNLLSETTKTLFKNEKTAEAAKNYVNMLPETLLAAPRALVTVALIPPILKYVFGWEKKKGASSSTKAVAQDYSMLNFKSSAETNNKAFQNFKGKSNKQVSFSGANESKIFEPLKKFFAPITTRYTKGMNFVQGKMAKVIAHNILETKIFQTLVEKTKDTKNLAAHLSALTGVTLSGFYMKKTLDNKDLDPQKKKTLAINQGSVCAVSTVLSYALNHLLTPKIEKFTKKFLALNAKDVELLSKYESGIKKASSLMIFGTMFRFIAPVLVTPLANHLGNKLQEKKEAEMIGKKQND